MLKRDRFAYPTLIFIFLSCFSFVALGLERHETYGLMLTFFAMYFSYFWIVRDQRISFREIAWIGIAARLILFFSLPVLSDDFYRFIWDGRLIDLGIDPFAKLPADLVEDAAMRQSNELFKLLNSPNYHSIYPPLNQFIFYLASAITDSYLISVNIIRFVVLSLEILGLYLLAGSPGLKDRKYLALYFLNPLLILEGVGNVHFEVIVAFFLLLFIYLFHKSRYFLSGTALGLAIATKLLPLIFLPYIFLRLWWKKGLFITLVAILVALLTFSPFLFFWDTDGLFQSIKLYFNKFEFNASIYFLAREMGYWQKGYNQIAQIGPLMAILSFLTILIVSLWTSYRKVKMSEALMWILTAYLLFATTVHPWYILPLILLGTLSGYYYPFVWSAAILVTYTGYTLKGYQLSSIWVLFEYFLVIGTMIFEIWKNYETNKSAHHTVDNDAV